MISLILGLIVGLLVGFIVSLYVMRWAVSDLREKAWRAARLRNQAEEVIENVHIELRKLKRENASLRNEIGVAGRQPVTAVGSARAHRDDSGLRSPVPTATSTLSTNKNQPTRR